MGHSIHILHLNPSSGFHTVVIELKSLPQLRVPIRSDFDAFSLNPATDCFCLLFEKTYQHHGSLEQLSLSYLEFHIKCHFRSL